jgi:hypothetical protein
MTVYPALASLRAIPKPNPRLPPVTMTFDTCSDPA